MASETENLLLEKLVSKISSKRKSHHLAEESKKLQEAEDDSKKARQEQTEENAAQPEENSAKPEAVPDLSEHFQILKKQTFVSRPKVAYSTSVSVNFPTTIPLVDEDPSTEVFSAIDPHIRENLEALGIKELFSVQKVVIPYVLEAQSKPSPFRPRDICVSSPTGSGKTLAFVIPVVQSLLKRTYREIRALVLLPTQELAEQVFNVFKSVCKGTKIVPALLSTTNALSQERAKLIGTLNGRTYSKVDIVVTTAGRLVEHLRNTEGFSLKNLRFLVIDEADRVIDQIQNDWLYHLDEHLHAKTDKYLMGEQTSLSLSSFRARSVQKLCFSATLSHGLENFQSLKLFQPKIFSAPSLTRTDSSATSQQKTNGSVERFVTPAGLSELYCLTEARLKPLTLYALIKENGWRRFLCFTNSTDSSHRLSFVLQELFGDEMVIEELSSTLSPITRKAVMHRFATFKVNGIISTDALSRGIDIPFVDVVFSYDMPKHIKTYIHRIGRTARAGQKGTAIVMLENTELKVFNKKLAEADKPNLTAITTKNDLEEIRALDYAKILKSLQKALVKEAKTLKQRSKPGKKAQPTSLLEQIKQQIHNDDEKVFKSHIPESWKTELIQKHVGPPKKDKGQFKKKFNGKKAPNKK